MRTPWVWVTGRKVFPSPRRIRNICNEKVENKVESLRHPQQLRSTYVSFRTGMIHRVHRSLLCVDSVQILVDLDHPDVERTLFGVAFPKRVTERQ